MLWLLWTQSDFASFQTHESLRLESKLRRRLSDFGVEEINFIGAGFIPPFASNLTNLRESKIQIVKERNDQAQPPGDQSRSALAKTHHSHRP